MTVNSQCSADTYYLLTYISLNLHASDTGTLQFSLNSTAKNCIKIHILVLLSSLQSSVLTVFYISVYRDVEDSIKIISDLPVERIIESAAKCITAINPNIRVPNRLPSGVSQRIEVAAQVASICKVTITLIVNIYQIVITKY